MSTTVRKMGDVSEILAVSEWNETEVLKDCIPCFYLWESIHESGSINSRNCLGVDCYYVGD